MHALISNSTEDVLLWDLFHDFFFFYLVTLSQQRQVAWLISTNPGQCGIRCPVKPVTHVPTLAELQSG